MDRQIKRIFFRVSEDRRLLIIKRASELGLSVSSYIKYLVAKDLGITTKYEKKL